MAFYQVGLMLCYTAFVIGNPPVRTTQYKRFHNFGINATANATLTQGKSIMRVLAYNQQYDGVTRFPNGSYAMFDKRENGWSMTLHEGAATYIRIQENSAFPRCPTGFDYPFEEGQPLPSGGFSASCYHFSIQELSVTDTRAYCQSLGGVRVSLETQQEHLHVKGVIDSVPEYQLIGALKSRYWTSGCYDGVWRWMSTGAEFTYTNWRDGHPVNEYNRCSIINVKKDCMFGTVNTDYGVAHILCETAANY